MAVDKLRYFLTEHRERFFFTYENLYILIHPSISGYSDLFNKLEDDIALMPEIRMTSDGTNVKFYKLDYNDEVYSKSELLAFIFAAVNSDWSVIKGADLDTSNEHFWLKHDDIIFDPSLAVITNESLYSEKFKQLQEIKNDEVRDYLIKNDNLHKFYGARMFEMFGKSKNSNFSINFIDKIVKEFNKNVVKEYTLDKKKIEKLKQYFMNNDFIELRQVLSQKRKSYLKGSRIAIHPSIDDSILDVIEKNAKVISELMKENYDLYINYYGYTLGNCYGLSILFNLFDGNFKLVQGGIPYQREYYGGTTTKYFYQHSWLEIGDIVYDPALRIVTPKNLYYIFVQKQDVYSKEETENILRRIGFNLTHFRDFMNGSRIGNDESLHYRSLVNKIDSPEMKDEGEKLIRVINTR